MSITIQTSTPHEARERFRELPADIPMWVDPRFSALTGDSVFLSALRGRELIGLWHLPLVREPGALVADRRPRLFPYASPWMKADLSQATRRTVMQALFRAATEGVEAMVLPMSPGVQDITGAIEEGAFAEWRHTYRLDVSIAGDLPRYDRTIANHLRAAARSASISMVDSCDEFAFDLAIKDPQVSNRQQRANLAKLLAGFGKVRIFRAFSESEVVGEALVVADQHVAYLFHSWFSPSGVRGIPSLLIHRAVTWAREEPRITLFDFEGSIIASVDRFMSSFPGRIAPYPIVYWDRDPQRLLRRINESLEIPGRRAA